MNAIVENLQREVVEIKTKRDAQTKEIKQKIAQLQQQVAEIEDPFVKQIDKLTTIIKNTKEDYTIIKSVAAIRNDIQAMYNINELNDKTLSDSFVGNRLSTFNTSTKSFDTMKAYLTTTSKSLKLNEKLVIISGMFKDFGVEELELV